MEDIDWDQMMEWMVAANVEKHRCIYENDDIIVISESGIKDISTIKTLNENNIHAFLVGESLITDNTPAITLKNMVG